MTIKQMVKYYCIDLNSNRGVQLCDQGRTFRHSDCVVLKVYERYGTQTYKPAIKFFSDGRLLINRDLVNSLSRNASRQIFRAIEEYYDPISVDNWYCQLWHRKRGPISLDNSIEAINVLSSNLTFDEFLIRR